MSLNVTFDGFCSLNDSTMSNLNVQYQAYFYKVNAGSSSSTWNNVRTVENTGYYNCNLGDADFLGQTGSAASGDKVIIVFWKGGSRMGTDCSLLEEWGATEYTLTAADVYTSPTQVKENIYPDLIWSFPTDGLAGTTYWSSNNSDDEHTWNWSGTIMAHWHVRYSEPIYYVNYVRFTSYDWDDGDQDNNLPGTSVGSHSWTLAGDYTVEIVIEDHCGATVTGTEVIRIKYPPPSPNIDCNEDVANHILNPDTVVTFDYNGTDPNSRIYNIDWTIQDDANTVTSGIVSDTIPHSNGTGTDWYGHVATPGAFTDPGIHNVAIVVHWNDGFDNQTINYNENFYQDYFSGPSVDFDQIPDPAVVTSGVIFNNLTSNDGRVGTAGAGEEYDWEWNDDGILDNVDNVNKAYVYSNYPASDEITVELCAHWNDGWTDRETCEIKGLAIETTVIVVPEKCYYELTVFGTSDDGTTSGYSWEISRSTSSGVSGPWELMWESPIGMDQKEKTICFGEENFYKVEAFVYGGGATTSDYEIVDVDSPCPSGVQECTLIVWNGTGIFDFGGDWVHSDYGVEAVYADAGNGTYGLDASAFTNNKKIVFQSVEEVNVDDYDLLSMNVNLREWGTEVFLSFEDGNPIPLGNYADTDKINTWQRVLIPLVDFDLTEPIDVRKLTFTSSGSNGFYLDDIEFVVGATLRGIVDIGRPDMEVDPANTPNIKANLLDFRPQMGAQDPIVDLPDDVDLPCTSGIAEYTLVIWNGTGILDFGGDWTHSNHGSESIYADSGNGTYGLDSTAFVNNNEIIFQSAVEVNVDNYDLLSMSINLKEWGTEITLFFEDGNSISLSNYVNTAQIDTWQCVLIPLEDFGLTSPINIKKLTFTSSGSNSLYIDDIAVLGGIIDIGDPDLEVDPANMPSTKANIIDFRPKMDAYPPPVNL